MKKIIAVAALLLMSACASVPMSTPEQDQEAKQFAAPPTGKSAIYVYRNTNFGAAIRIPVSLDNVKIGNTAAHTYIYTLVDAGYHRVSSHSENTPVLDFEAKSGQKYFINQEINMGWVGPRTKLKMKPAAEGQQAVLTCKRIANLDAPEAALK